MTSREIFAPPFVATELVALATLVRCGDWPGLAAALAAGGALSRPADSDRSLLAILADGRATDGPASLPSYALSRAVGRSTPVPDRLRMIAETAEPACAMALLRAALGFDPDHTAVLMALAWRCYDAGALDEAALLARQAEAVDLASVDAAASLGWFLMQAGDLDGAASALDRALTLRPDDPIARWWQGTLFYRRGRLPAAEAALRAALRQDPGLDEARITLGWLLHDRCRFAEALDHSRHAVAAAPLPHRLVQLGWLLACVGNADPAIDALRRALAGAPADPDIRCKLADVLARQGRAVEAWNLLRDGLALAPGNPALLASSGWLHRALGETEDAARIAIALTASAPDNVAAWDLLATLREDVGAVGEAEACLARAQALVPGRSDLVVRRAALLGRLGRPDDAAWLVEMLLDGNPDAADARLLLARLRLDQGRPDAARQLLHRLLAQRDADPAPLWHLLAAALQVRGRRFTARLAIRRACRLAPHSIDVLRLRAWLELDCGDVAAARATSRTLLDRVPDDPAALSQAAFIALAADTLPEASRLAERATVLAPSDAEAWRSLGQVRFRQQRWEDAEACLHTALGLSPERVELLRALGWVLVGADRLAEAEIAFLRAVEVAPTDPTCRLELGEARCLSGRFALAARDADAALAAKPRWATARRLRARCAIAQGFAEMGASRATRWAEAASDLAMLLRDDPADAESAVALLRLAAAGCDAAWTARRLVPRKLRRARYHESLEWGVAHAGAAELAALATLARQDFPDDAEIACTGLYVAAMGGSAEPAALAREVRAWGRRFTLTTGIAPPVRPPRRLGARLRVAYVASYLHGSLLLAVIAAHDPALVEVFLFTDQVAEAEGRLGGSALVLPLTGNDLAEALVANRIDVVVDTAGLHACHGQFEVVRALCRRVVPLQCGWLGSWGGGGGLFDVLIADPISAPEGVEIFCEEAILRVPGGQWAWTPPLHAPDPGPPPLFATGHVVFGSAVRGFRLSAQTLTAWARLLARVPRARLELIGSQSRDWRLRAEIARVMAAHGVEPERVGYQFRRGYADYLAWFRSIDVALDAMPANGGLGTLDALWMGVPVVTGPGDPAGPGFLASAQGRSILQAIGRAHWAADTLEDYVDRAAALVAEPAALRRERETLRRDLLASPLVDARRVARALEDGWRAHLSAAVPIAAATDPKTFSRLQARRALGTWLAHDARLTLPRAAQPDVTVVMVLFNQAGLTRQALTALADQADVAFETILVDNGSSDETAALLDRTDGAVILRNPENRHFLRAANQGAAKARGRHILFLNSDAIVQTGALKVALDRLEGDLAIGAVGGRIILGDGGLQEAGCVAFGDGSTIGYGRGRDPDAPEFRFVRDVDFCSGAFLLVRGTTWQALKGFDPSFAPAYYEDTDFCFRAREAGFRVVYEPRAVIGHLEWGSAARSDDATARMAENRGVFLARHRGVLGDRQVPHMTSIAARRSIARPGPRVLILDNAVPHAAEGAGLPRARLMLQVLARHDVTLFPLWDYDDDWHAVYETVPAEVEVMLDHGAPALEHFLADRRGLYDVLLVSRPPNLAFVNALRRRRPELFEGMRLVYDAEALFALRDIGQAAVEGRPLSRFAQARLIADEIVQARAADRVLAVCERDAERFRRGGLRDVRIVAHGMAARTGPVELATRRGMLFIGALNTDTPNEDGLLWFVREVMPNLPRDMTLAIVGECRSNRVAALESTAVRLLGRVDDLTPLYDTARLFVAPARFAGGIPAKVVEAACHGLPVVASAILARQLGWAAGTEILPARDAREFAASIKRLSGDDDLWHRLRRGMQARVAAQFDPQDFAAAVRAAVAFGASISAV